MNQVAGGALQAFRVEDAPFLATIKAVDDMGVWFAAK
jgi:hypothetical protein